MRVAIATLGCKVNQVEGDTLRDELTARGATIVPFADSADVYVVNTCSVTARSDAQCRQVIRTAVRRGGKVVVTGCFAATRPEDVRRIGDIALIVPNDMKHRLPEAVLELGGDALPARPAAVSAVSRRTRGFLKIQDGCDGVCSYCIVPKARGRSRSVPAPEVIASFDRLIGNGVPEIVLSGIHVGRYGADLGGGMSLTKLLLDLVTRRGPARIRLSSVEPREITDELIGLMGNGVCRHLHIPLQSGDDDILAAMRRDYDTRWYRRIIERIAAAVPDVALGADVMVGFPGEGEREFRNTLRFVEELPLTHFHVFSFSARPGTEAARMTPQVPEAAKRERSAALREVGNKKNLLFRQRLVGKVLTAVREDRGDAASGWGDGLTDNYVRLRISGASSESRGRLEAVRITAVEGDETTAAVLSSL